MKKAIHTSHLGIDGCLRRARESLFWPGMSGDIKDEISRCTVCHTYQNRQQKESLMSHEIPDRPWSKIGIDLFEYCQENYLISVDYYSNFWEVDRLETTSSKTVVGKLKKLFARYGIPSQVMSDNGPQFTSSEFKNFSKDWDFEHYTSSSHHPKSNGKAESAVKTAKQLVRKAKEAKSDVYLVFLDFRNTPTQGVGTSPAQRMLGRRTRTLLPTATTLLQPRGVMQSDREKLRRQQQTANERYNKRAKNLNPLHEGDQVRIQPVKLGEVKWRKAVVNKRLDERSYLVETPSGELYR